MAFGASLVDSVMVALPEVDWAHARGASVVRLVTASLLVCLVHWS